MDEGLLEYFEGIKAEFLSLSLDEFTVKVHNENHKLEFWSAVNSTHLASDWTPFQDAKNTSTNETMPRSLREDSYSKLKYKVDEIIAKIKSGSVSITKKRIPEEVINLVSDSKVKAICIELNNTPDSNVLSLTENLGECLKWCLWYRAKQVGTSLKESGNLGPLLEESINQSYYSDNAVNRFLKDFKDNFLKTDYDMVRHSASYIPDIAVINPAIDALEHILKSTFP